MNHLAPVQPNPAVVVIGPQFCMGLPVELTTVRKRMTLSHGHFRVRDVNGNIMFKIKGKLFNLHHRRVMYDAAGNPIITLQRKLTSSRWKVFRFESTDAEDMLFSIRRSSLRQMILELTKNLHVFLASNTREEVCDFKIEDRWCQSSCVVHAGNSNSIIAQMQRNHSARSILLGKDSFGVTVYPNVDYAFVVALAVLIEDIKDEMLDAVRNKFMKIVMRIFNPTDLITNKVTDLITN